jgi:hypothetical protein
MRKTFLAIVSILLIAAQACAPSIPATSDPGVINTAVAQTLAAMHTQTAGIPVTGDESPTPTETAIEVASPTPTMTAILLTITPALSSTPILTPGVVQVYVSVPTNCRMGPSVDYPRVGGLQLDQVANVVGRNPTGDYWIIRNPSRASETCWLWGRYATVVGDTSALPVFTPPPLPTPDPGFAASLRGVESCTDTGNWWLDIALENTGGITFQSFFMTVTDTVTGTALSLYRDNFIDRDGCAVEEDQGDLDPEDTLIVSSPNFTYDPSGHRIRTRITVCSNLGQSGTCLTQSFDFTP